MEPDERFWENLLRAIEKRAVIPVVGSELLAIEAGGESVRLYRAVAERLLSEYAVQGASLREHHELNDAVCAVAAKGTRVNELYPVVSGILEKLLAGQNEPIESFSQLASISFFDLFVTTTPDDLMARALDAVRFGGTSQTDQIEHAPKLPTDQRRDIPVMPPSKYTAVFYLFGKASVDPVYAIHDEDALEFLYSLQQSEEPVGIFSQLRRRNLLLIGCDFADWLNPFFLRMSNSVRLFSDRPKKEYLVGQETSKDKNFTVFLERFSQDSRCVAIEAPVFVAELYRRWRERHPDRGIVTPSPAEAASGAAALSGDTIFISYSSDDIGAARNLARELNQIGGNVAEVWFDKSAIKPGDDWDQEIRAGIQRCTLFLPLISANTERYYEKYLFREWGQAVERSESILNRKFIIPIVIDPDYTGDARRYRQVPEKFAKLQYIHAPAGQMNDVLKAEITEQLRGLRRAGTV